MSLVYLDTSALVKQYVTEVGSNWVRTLVATTQGSGVFISQLTLVEMTCAFARRWREGNLSAIDHSQLLVAFDYDVSYRYYLLDVQPAVVTLARQLANRHPLRAYDAVQLATAWLANENLLNAGQSPLVFVCADDLLIAMAQAEGLSVDNPNRHP